MVKRLLQHIKLGWVMSAMLCIMAANALAAGKDDSKWLPQGASVSKDIVYKETALGDLRLDLYMPAGKDREARPVVLFIHGGSWMHGNKEEITSGYRIPLLRRLLEAGIAVASMDYRLVNDSMTVVYPKPLADCKDAVRWLMGNAAQLGIDGDRIALMGTSAGGHLALMTAYAPDSLAQDVHPLSHLATRVRCVVDIYGPTDLCKILRPALPPTAVAVASTMVGKEYIDTRNCLLWAFSGESNAHPLRRRRACQRYSPINYVKTAVPTIAIHGNADRLVPYHQSEMLRKALKEQGMDMEIVTLEGLPHGFKGITAQQVSTLVDRTLQFLNENLLK
ncbi:MAG: alpha/beta hydrolase [Bacteroidaceae bacterium]|nr:alpha/beta hydrolase [Bacteroidaceae bacterium]